MAGKKVTVTRVMEWFKNQNKYALKTLLKGDIKGKTEVLIHCNDCGYERYKVLSEILAGRYSCMGCLKIKKSKAMKGVSAYSNEEYKEELKKACPKVICISEYTNGQDKGKFVCFNCGEIYTGRYASTLHYKKYLCNKCSYQKRAIERAEKDRIDFYNRYKNGKYLFNIKDVPASQNECFNVICRNCGSTAMRNRRQVVRGSNCPICEVSASSGEKSIINVLRHNNIEFIKEYYFINPLLENKGQRMDFYIPKINLFIEFQGKQHYEQSNKWNTPYLEKRDRAKFAYAFQRGWMLCYIFENEDIFIQLQEIFYSVGIVLDKPYSEYKVNYSIKDVLNFAGKDGIHIDDVCNRYKIGRKTFFRYIKISGYKNFNQFKTKLRWKDIPDEDFLDYASHNGLANTATHYDKTIKTTVTHLHDLGYKNLYELQIERKTIIDAYDDKLILDLIVSNNGLKGASEQLGFPKYVLEHYLPKLGYKNYVDVVNNYDKK